MSSKLTDRQRRFADLVLEGMPASRAYRAAGYKAATDGVAETNSSRLIKADQVAAYFAVRRAAAAERSELSLASIMQDLSRFANDKAVDAGSRLGAYKTLLDHVARITPAACVAGEKPQTVRESDFALQAFEVTQAMARGQIAPVQAGELLKVIAAGAEVAHADTVAAEVRGSLSSPPSPAPQHVIEGSNVVRPKWFKPAPARGNVPPGGPNGSNPAA